VTEVEVKPYIELKDFPKLTPFSAAAIRSYMHRGELVEGKHYFRAPGRGQRPGRLVFKWAAIEAWIERRELPDDVTRADPAIDIVPIRPAFVNAPGGRMSPRSNGRRCIGAFINVTPGGRLRLNFRWPLGCDGKLYRVTTDLSDTVENRRELERVRDLVGAEIRCGTFVLGNRFPTLVAPKIILAPVQARRRSLVERMAEWIAEKALRKVRRSRVRDYGSHLENYFARSAISERDPSTLCLEDLRAFQLWLVSKAGQGGTGVSEKAAANVVRGTLRAFLRDIGATEAMAALEQLVWETKERDTLLKWFRARRPFQEYVSITLRFCGLTPSEVRGLDVGDFDRATDTVKIARSRHLGATGATKTRARERVVSLGDAARDVETLCGLRDPGDRLLLVAEDTLRDNFTKAQKALGMRHRSLYQAKHTHAVLALLDGESPAVVARSLGISLATLEKHYAAALQKGRTIAVETPRETPRRVVGGKNAREQKRPRRDLVLISRASSQWKSVGRREPRPSIDGRIGSLASPSRDPPGAQTSMG
jgi:integrase